MFHGIRPSGERVNLLYAADMPIKRHIKIKAEATLYDPTWEMYFERRLEMAWRDSRKGQRKLLRLWIEQDKRCLVCGYPLTKETGVHVHHRHRKTDGGSDRSENLVLLHPNCHIQAHSLGISVEKPAQF